jgi:hypothetical protein
MCRHSELELEECDGVPWGNDYYVCLGCGAEFYRKCSLYNEEGSDPWATPAVSELIPADN